MSKPVRTGPLTPYEKIVRAARRGTGCRLSCEDVVDLSRDNANETRAELDLEERQLGLVIRKEKDDEEATDPAVPRCGDPCACR